MHIEPSQPAQFPIEKIFVFGDGRTVIVVPDSEPERKLLEKSVWVVKQAGSDEVVTQVEIESEMLERGRDGQRSLITLDTLTFDTTAVNSDTWILHRLDEPAEKVEQSRPPPEPEVVGRAAAFAALHHGDQRRKDSNRTPYVAHLFAVAALALEDGGSQDQAVAGLLHDTLEDCPDVTTDLLVAEFGEAVAAIVVGCTDFTPGAERGKWRERKQSYLEHLRQADEAVLLVSNADKLHNLSSLLADFAVEVDPAHALSRFSNPDGIVWYYSELDKVFSARRPGRRNQVRFGAAVDSLRGLLA